jgi:hypothetical protein
MRGKRFFNTIGGKATFATHRWNCESPLFEMPEIHHSHADFAGEIDQRNRECRERNDKQDCDPVLMREVVKCNDKSDDQKQRSRNATGNRPQNRIADQSGPHFEDCHVVWADDARSVNDPIEPTDQNSEESRQRPSRKAGAAACAITFES